MKTLLATSKNLKAAGRWDIDFHLPPIGIKQFPEALLTRVSACADIVKTKRDPTKKPELPFLYIDIASIDVSTGTIAQPQELTGEEAPSRARKVVHAFDIIISTCRPTRGAIAIVPEHLHGQICSTGFTVVRPKPGVNPFYLHFALRMESTLEQFRKWGTGSSYPAILDEDVAKTKVPMPSMEEQDSIALAVRAASVARDSAIGLANKSWQSETDSVLNALKSGAATSPIEAPALLIYSIGQVAQRISELPQVEEEAVTSDDELLTGELFGNADEE